MCDVSVNNSIIWVQEDALRDTHPAALAAGKGVPAYFIWDDDYFNEQGYSLKRLMFIYECLYSMNVTILKGDPVEILSTMEATVIYTAQTPHPHIHKIIEAVSQTKTVHLIADEAFSSVPIDAEMGRFFKFWNRARKSMMSQNGEAQRPDH